MLTCVVNKLLGEAFLVVLATPCSRSALEHGTVVPDAVQRQYLIFWSWIFHQD